MDKLPSKYIKGLIWMSRKHAKDMEKESFKGSSRAGNIGVPKNVGRQMRKAGLK